MNHTDMKMGSIFASDTQQEGKYAIFPNIMKYCFDLENKQDIAWQCLWSIRAYFDFVPHMSSCNNKNKKSISIVSREPNRLIWAACSLVTNDLSVEGSSSNPKKIMGAGAKGMKSSWPARREQQHGQKWMWSWRNWETLINKQGRSSRFEA